MKFLNVIFSLCFLLFLSVHIQAQHNHDHDTKTKDIKEKGVIGKTDIFMVYGNCGMCESRIEGALSNIKGIHSADWDVDNKVMTVKYDEAVITLDDMKKKVAAVGHDTDKYKAKSEIYVSLPGCCQYNRPKD